MKKNLVMGVAKGYDWNPLEPFVISFKRNCPGADLVLFVDDISDFTRDKLLCVGVENIPADYKDVMIIHARWKTYLDFLEKYGTNYEQVLVTDTRDVIFQGDPFVDFKNNLNWLGYSTEEGSILPAGKQPVDYIWIKSRFGKEEADKLADKPAICCGTVIGSVNEMKMFCLKMWDFLKNDTVWGHEQASMNYFIYENLLPIENIIELDGQTSAIFTMALSEKISVKDGLILRGDGGVPAVVHQYDRHAELVQLVDRISRDRNFQADERFTDPRSILEQVKHLLYLNKPDDAARFFMNVKGANFGEHINILLKIWELLLNHSLVPAVGYLELSVQSALAFSSNIQIQHLNAICSLLIHAIKNRRAVDPQLVQFIAGGLMNIVEQTLTEQNAGFCFYCIDAIKALDLPPNKAFYLLQARANRIFGRKEAALAAYQKALDLS